MKVVHTLESRRIARRLWEVTSDLRRAEKKGGNVKHLAAEFAVLKERLRLVLNNGWIRRRRR